MKLIKPLLVLTALFSFSTSDVFAQGNGGPQQNQSRQRQCDRENCNMDNCNPDNCQREKVGRGQGQGRGNGQRRSQGRGGMN